VFDDNHDHAERHNCPAGGGHVHEPLEQNEDAAFACHQLFCDYPSVASVRPKLRAPLCTDVSNVQKLPKQ
jgi:hypothetical protein